MNRVFLVQESYIKDRCDPDGYIIYHLLQQYARQNYDEVLPHEDFSCPSTTVRNAAKQNKKVIPVGNLEFVESGINQIYGLHEPMQPIEIPESLRKFCYREYQICKGKDISRINILSEFRVFVWKDKIISVQNYSGMPDIFPKTQELRDMVKAYSEKRPDAYTIDVAVIVRESVLKTAILEIRPFVSCKLYGFYNSKIPDMLEAGIDWFVNNP